MNGDGVRFSVLPTRSVEVYAESIGIASRNLGEDVAENLGEDVTYRVREALQNAVRFMKHSKRKHLTVEDFNKGLKWANVEQVYGHSGMELANFKSLSQKDTNLQVFYVEEKEINLRELSLDFSLPPDSGDISVRAQWLVFEGITCPGGKLGKDEISWSKERLEEPYLVYLETLISSIFGNYQSAQRKAVQSLRELPQLQVVLPNLISFLVVKVKAANENSELFCIVDEMLVVIKALIENCSLFLNPYVLQLVKLLLFIIVEGHLDVQHWHYKQRASVILANLCRRHMITMQHLPHQLLKAFQDCCMDAGRSIESVYGAVVGLISLGAEALFQVLYPNIKSKLRLVTEAINSKDYSQSHGAVLLHAALRDAVICLIKKYASNSCGKSHSTSNHPQVPRNPYSLYLEFIDDFGESITAECLTCANLSNTRANPQQNRGVNVGSLTRESESSRTMILTYLDGIKSTACDRVDAKFERCQRLFDKKEHCIETSVGQVSGHYRRKRQLSIEPGVQKCFGDLVKHPKRTKVDRGKAVCLAVPRSRKLCLTSKSKSVLLYDIAKISLSISMPL